MMGGIPTNVHGQVVTINGQGQDMLVEGLYAVGECACVSVHGSNRLGGNSLLDLVVFGRAAGIDLVDRIRREDIPQLREDQHNLQHIEQRLNRLNNSTEGEDVNVLRTEMQQTMQSDFGVFRTAEYMQQGIEKLRNIKERSKNIALKDKTNTFNTARIEILEFENLIDVALATAVCAEARTESRGAHCRYDFPDRDDENWIKHTVYMSDGSIHYRAVNMHPEHVEAFPPKKRTY